MPVFGLISQTDTHLLSELCATQTDLSAGDETFDPSIVAALLLYNIKSLAAPVKAFTEIATSVRNEDIIENFGDSMALNFVQFQLLANLPSTLVQIIEQQCFDLADSFDEKTKVNLFRYFLSCCSLANESNDDAECLAYAQYLEEFEKLLSHTLASVCSNIQRNLEDLMDFDFLWDASTDKTFLFSSDSSVEETAKELAWALSRTTCQSVLREDGTDVLSCERRYRILHEAACIDLVLAAMLAQIFPSNGETPEKRLRSERDPRDVRQHLLRCVGDLLVAVTDEEIIIQQSDLNIAAEQVATSVLPFVDDRKKMGTDEKFIPVLLSCILSHQQRQTSLLRLKERQTSIVAENATEVLAHIPSHLPNVEKAIELARHVSRLQQRTSNYFHGFYKLDFAQRKMLAPFVLEKHHHETGSTGTSRRIILACCYNPAPLNQHQEGHNMTPSMDYMNAIHISGWKEPPLSDIERGELQRWIDYASIGAGQAFRLKPSPKLMVLLKASSIPPATALTNGIPNTHVLTWEMVALPVLNHCLNQTAEDFGMTGRFAILETGEHIVPFVGLTSGHMIVPSSILRFYYAALDVILHHDAAKRKCDANPSMVLNLRFHSSLFALCRFCLHRALHLTGHQHNIHVTTENQSLVIDDIGTCPIVYYKLIESFIKGLTPGSEYVASFYQGQVLPSRIILSLRRLQEMLLGLMWMPCCVEITGDVESTFVGMINKLKENPNVWRQVCPIGTEKEFDNTLSNEKERMFVRYILRNLVKVMRRRTLEICKQLLVPQTSTITSKTMMVFTNMLYHRVEIFIDRHPDQLMLCSLYLVCSKMKLAPNVSFQKIKDAYMEMNESFYNTTTLNTIFYEMKLSSSNNDCGNIVSFYNSVFTPNLRPFWKSFING